MSTDFVLKSLTSYDGTEIAYQIAGDGPGLPLVLSNGLGGDYRAWQHVVAHFAPGRRVLTWDYRGLYRSGAPHMPGTLGPAQQVRDLEQILAAESIDRVIAVGWSMGCQVNFEAWRQFPSRIAGLGVINGVSGKPFHTALGLRLSRHVIPTMIKIMRKRARWVSTVTDLAVGWQGLLPAMQRFGLVGATMDLALFGEFSRSFSSLDFDRYGATFEALGAHDATDVLPTIDVPMVILAGLKDLLTPPETAYALEAAVPHARLRVLDAATHYLPVEFPTEVCEEIDWLVNEVERRRG